MNFLKPRPWARSLCQKNCFCFWMLTHLGLVMPYMVIKILVNIASGNGLLPHITKPLPEPGRPICPGGHVSSLNKCNPIHHLNQCELLISEVLWHSPETNFAVGTDIIILHEKFKIYTVKITDIPSRAQWVKPPLNFSGGYVMIQDMSGWW